MKPYLTNLAIKNAGYKTLTQFCRAHGMKLTSIQQYNYRVRDDDRVMPQVQNILDLEATQKELKEYKDLIQAIQLKKQS